jgi:hypothetical protein
MTTTPYTLIADDRLHEVEARLAGEAIHLAPEDVTKATGWHLDASGLCRGDTCVPVRDRAALGGDDGIELAALARLLDRPLALDPEERVAVLGESAANRSGTLRSLIAPDFALPDLAGRPHRLSDHREKKRLLIAWASW